MAVNIPPDNITYVRKRELTLSCMTLHAHRRPAFVKIAQTDILLTYFFFGVVGNDDQACKSLGGNVVCFDEKSVLFFLLSSNIPYEASN